VARKLLIISVMEGQTCGKHFFRTSVGKGSRKHVDELMVIINLKTLSTLTVAKFERAVESEFFE